MHVSTWATLDLAARYRDRFVESYHEMARDAIEKGKTEPPYAFMIPAAQKDPGTVRRLLANLGTNRRPGDASARSRRWSTASRTRRARSSCRAIQAFRTHIVDLLEPQRYPELRTEAGGEVIRPYDASGWTLPLQFGVTCVAAGTPLREDAQLEGVDAIQWPVTTVAVGGDTGSRAWSVSSRANDAYTLVNRALARGMSVRRERGGNCQIFSITANSEELVSLARGLTIEAAPDVSQSPKLPLPKPRVAVLMPAQNSMDSGWTRLVLEEHGFDPTMVGFPELRAGRLRERFDAVILPDISATRLRDGAGRSRVPAALQGGLGTEGGRALRAFVDDGGRLLAFAGSIPYTVETLEMTTKTSTGPRDDEGRAAVACPGTVLRALVRPGTTTNGYEGDLAVYVRGPRVLELPEKYGRGLRAVLTYPKTDLLLSGYLKGGEHLAGQPLLVEERRGKGMVFLYAFRPQHRSQPLGTFRLIFNALYGGL